MSTQRFDLHTRHAIWEAGKKTCAYCGRKLRFNEVEIDHVLPEKPNTSSEDLAKEHLAFGLPEDFNRSEFHNLLPSCHSCNQDKLARSFLSGQIAIFVAQARERVSQVSHLREKYRHEESQEKLQLLLARSLSNGKVSKDDVQRWLRENNDRPSIFKFQNEGLSLGLDSLKEISPGQIEAAMDAPVKLPSGMADSLRLVLEGQEVRAKTLREYASAIEKGFYAETNAEMIIQAGYFETPLQILGAVRNARIADVSFIDEPNIGVTDVDYLPADLLFSYAEMTDDPLAIEASKRPNNATINDLLSQKKVRIARLGSKFIEFEDEFSFTLLVEVMRADFDGDGIQDLLLQRVCGPIDGTHRIIGTVVLSKRSLSGNFGVIPSML